MDLDLFCVKMGHFHCGLVDVGNMPIRRRCIYLVGSKRCRAELLRFRGLGGMCRMIGFCGGVLLIEWRVEVVMVVVGYLCCRLCDGLFGESLYLCN